MDDELSHGMKENGTETVRQGDFGSGLFDKCLGMSDNAKKRMNRPFQQEGVAAMAHTFERGDARLLSLLHRWSSVKKKGGDNAENNRRLFFERVG
jgi:hypothetical protein